ncbi:hypothetical protein NMG60_11022309 [Bertholletia excelsa]
MMFATRTRSSLELMLDSIRQREEQQATDVPPALPSRPASRARLPPARKALSVSFKKSGLRENSMENVGIKEEYRDLAFNLGGSVSRSVKREGFSELTPNEKSEEGGDFTAIVAVSDLVPDLHKKNKCGNDDGFVVKKVELVDCMDDTRERALERILEIQKYFRGHQTRCYYLELRRGTITLQSFVRGEKARKDYQILTRRLAAVILIQQHTKKWIEWRIVQKRQRTAVCLQSVIRGWLTRRSLNHKRNFRLVNNGVEPVEHLKNPDSIDPEIKVSVITLAELQRQLVRVETELAQKEEENAALRQKLQQYNNKWSQYEAKMKSMEKLWQDQLTSLQMSLVAAKKSLTSECTTDQPGMSPMHHCYSADETMKMGSRLTDGRRELEDLSNFPYDTESQLANSRINGINQVNGHHKMVFHDNARGVGAIRSVYPPSSTIPEDELQKLRMRFEAWKKDYKVRLQETKATLQKVGQAETKKGRKKWWGR